MACAELAPLVKLGPAADAIAALAKTLCRMEHKVTVVLPRYATLASSGLMLARRLAPLKIEVGGATVEATLFDARLASGLELVLIDLPGMFERPAPEGEPDREDGKRYGLFCRAVAALVDKRAKAGVPFDAVHAHDWTTALVPLCLQGQGVRTVLTVHDARQQGRFDKALVDEIGLSWDDFHPALLEFYGELGMLKAGVMSADVVTTVSPSYADEIQMPAGGAGLDGVFRARGAELVGILDGVDYAEWSPATDPHIAARYDAEDVANKGRCKASLLREIDWPIEPERPLLVSLGPVSAAHGSDVLARALGDIVKADARIVIAGVGDAALAKRLEDAAASLPGDAVYLGAVSDAMTHRLVAGADAVLVAPAVEPSGQLQQIAQRYGAPPIVHAVGGLRDTVVDADASLETGTGFSFEGLAPLALAGAVQRAVAAMKSPAWAKLRRRVMRLDRSWERPARRYARLYQSGAA